LRALTGCEDAVVVNNCAAAVLLALSALASGKEAVVSRGELVEIGGGFRIPDVMRQSGARLVEVGTTNRTRVADYERALGPETALLLKVHPSNFAVVGFTEEAPVEALAALAHARGLPLVCDLGSGNVALTAERGLTREPTARSLLASGADLVCFSGDKLLGGPQAGILVGRSALISRVKSHPLNRALRVDKLTVGALEATLELYRDGRAEDIPTVAMLTQSPEALRMRAEKLLAALAAEGVSAEVREVVGQVGGGSMPLAEPVSYACTLEEGDNLQERLREGEPPVVCRVSEGRVVLDVRCLAEDALVQVAQAVREAKGRSC
jgi:L-seryl-tRNA(Ser) seleniumtransferase